MIKLNKFKFIRVGVIALAISSLMFSSCKKSVLDEEPQAFFSQKLTDLNAFNAASVGMYIAARDEQFRNDGVHHYIMSIGTDIATKGENGGFMRDYNIDLVPSGGENFPPTYYWDWGFVRMLPKANLIITQLEENGAALPEADRNRLAAEARFFRAYTYNILVNLFGAVPIVDKFVTEPRTDFTRAPRAEVLEFIKKDLEFAVQYLPLKGTGAAHTGRITRAAGHHLLSLVYIQLQDWDKAIAAATAVINGSDGPYALMQNRFGTRTSIPNKDVFWDLFRTGNVNTAANTETIWALQFEKDVTGGSPNSALNGGMIQYRGWVARWVDAKTPPIAGPVTGFPNGLPGGLSGMTTRKDINSAENTIDTLIRGVAWCRPTNYWTTNIWRDKNDIRNSNANVRRNWVWSKQYINETGSRTDPANRNPYFGQIVNTTDKWNANLDTIVHIFAQNTKTEDVAMNGTFNGGTAQDFYKMRLAETYLLRAEAYLGKGQTQLAADDINVVRRRAKAADVLAADVNIDYILDERARELVVEENRRITLARLGKLYERAKLYCSKAAFPARFPNGAENIPMGETMQPHHVLFPIPQSVRNANTGAPFPQNPGYPQ